MITDSCLENTEVILALGDDGGCREGDAMLSVESKGFDGERVTDGDEGMLSLLNILTVIYFLYILFDYNSKIMHAGNFLMSAEQ